MGFVRVSGYSESDLQLSKLNAPCDLEFFYCSGADKGNKILSFKFGKDYAWALICSANTLPISSANVWTGTSDLIYLDFNINNNTTTGGHNAEMLNNPRATFIRDVKKGDIYGRKNGLIGGQGQEATNVLAAFNVIACPYESGKGVKPDENGGFFIGSGSDHCRYRAKEGFPYGSNNNKWYYQYPSGEPVYIPPITVVPTTNSNPEDQEDPVNPGDPDGPTGG